MKKITKNIAIFPARGESKRIKGKNIKKFNSKPIIELAFKIARRSKLFDKIIITTDSNKVLKLGKKIGFDILIKRPKKLSSDHIGTAPVIKHAIQSLKQKINFDNVCCIYPCNPFIQSKDLKNCVLKLKKNKDNFIFPITNFSHPIERALNVNKTKRLNYVIKKFAKKRTQDFKIKYHDTGQFYFASKEIWLNLKKAKKIGLEVPSWRVVDIDNESDWKRAEIFYKFIKKNNLLKLI